MGRRGRRRVHQQRLKPFKGRVLHSGLGEIRILSEISPWLQEQLSKYEQLQATLQSVLMQKQQVDVELTEIKSALEELEKAPADAEVFKQAGLILVKADKEKLKAELLERKELAETRHNILEKQEERLRENLQDLQNKIREALTAAKKPS
ncbi:MAG TPA: prefoldin subunit beta [Nitrososphaeria archaeon]|nr:MAG: prefoldin subunit beta [Nitrososphaera sp.]HEU16113.1 prefoldin subunit beta [Nitrososphaeria archaeon]